MLQKSINFNLLLWLIVLLLVLLVIGLLKALGFTGFCRLHRAQVREKTHFGIVRASIATTLNSRISEEHKTQITYQKQYKHNEMIGESYPPGLVWKRGAKTPNSLITAAGSNT